MTEHANHPLQRALYRILRPLARLLIRNGIPFGEFADLMRRAYVEAALGDSGDSRKKPTDSRAAIMTGLTRKEVRRQRDILAGEPVINEARQGNRASRVVAGWVHDPMFQDAQGQPAVLLFDGDRGFSDLVRRYSGDMTPRAVLDELLRVGVVSQSQDGDGGLILRKRAYVPAGDDAEMLHIFGEDVSDLIATIDYNLTSGKAGRQPLFQRTLTYNNIPPTVIRQWRERAAADSQRFLEELDRWLGPHDQDVHGQENRSSATQQPAVRTGVSVFYFEEPLQADTDVGDDT